MAKKNIKPGQQARINAAEKKYREDMVFFKSSVLFLMLCAVVLFTLRLGDFGNTFRKMTASFAPYAYGNVQLMFIFGILTIAAAIYFIFCKKSGKDESVSFVSSTNLLCITAFCELYCFTYHIDGSNLKLLVLTVLCGALYYINKFYNRDFVWYYLLNVALCFNIWTFFGAGIASRPAMSIIFKLAGIIGVLAVCFFAYKCYKNSDKGQFILWPFVVSVAIFAVLAVLCSLVMTVTSVFAMVVMLVQFIIVGVYYTVKMLKY